MTAGGRVRSHAPLPACGPSRQRKAAAPCVKGRSLSVELSGRTERGQGARSPLHAFLHTGGHRVVRQPPPVAAARAHTSAREDLDDVRACPLRHEELLDRGQDAAVLAHQRSAMAAV